MSRITHGSSEQIITDLFALADITINGSRPWDIQVHKQEFYEQILCDGSLALGESYMAGWWDCLAIDQFIFRVLRNDLHHC
ncbi:MAG: hypothetical protein J0652_12045 [Desulfobulbaceae bacterium]|jgi:cyclopropane-fatty-acyl-phospholipid synthase|nr:hypothetical protein [Desulfobulbaceae bacterium]